jgi:hypothetical protein
MKKSQASQKTERGICMITRHILDEVHPVGFMYREEPEEELDSGWRFLSGLEDDDYMEQEENSVIVDVDLVLVLEPLVKKYLHLPYGSELERNGNEFIPYNAS